MLDHSAATLTQHILFFFLLIVAPLWDYYDTRRLKRHPSSERKVGYYRTLVAWLWIATVAACLSAGLRPLLTISPAPGEIPWLSEHAWVSYLVASVISLVMAVMLLPVAVVVWKKLKKQTRKYSSADALQSLSYFFPATWNERRWFTLVCITAGICEEALFRGFLVQYLHSAPWKLNLTLTLLLASAIFGLQHLYLGAGGVLSTTLSGILFGLLFLLTGNLLLPMVLHAVSDLRMLLLLRPPGSEVAAAT